jgi:hypothetical protein
MPCGGELQPHSEPNTKCRDSANAQEANVQEPGLPAGFDDRYQDAPRRQQTNSLSHASCAITMHRHLNIPPDVTVRLLPTFPVYCTFFWTYCTDDALCIVLCACCSRWDPSGLLNAGPRACAHVHDLPMLSCHRGSWCSRSNSKYVHAHVCKDRQRWAATAQFRSSRKLAHACVCCCQCWEQPLSWYR